MDPSWFKVIAAALGSGLFLKLLDISHSELRRKKEHSETVKEFVDDHLDPILKSADELVGKLRNLAMEDFSSLKKIQMENEKYENADLTSLLFLISKFWAHIEILRAESVAIKIGKDKRGQQLQNFINSLESRKVRIVDRITQRAIGEILISIRSEKLETIKFIEFVNLIENDAMAKRWLEPLVQIVSRTSHTNERQQLLQYGVIVHALIDTLDPEHISTRQRPSYPSKLSKKTWTGLNYRIFGHYLKCVEQTAKYLGPPKAGGPKKR